jgi:hypothetical protein
VYEWSINRVTNPNLVSSHTQSRDDMIMYCVVRVVARLRRKLGDEPGSVSVHVLRISHEITETEPATPL